MIGLLQVVTHAEVKVANEIVGAIKKGLLVFLGVQNDDSFQKADRLAERVLGYRIFLDQNNKMNCNVLQVGGGILVVPQFTLVAETKKGMRPGFSRGADPDKGEFFFNYFVQKIGEKCSNVATGKFRAEMQVSLCNDGPSTFWLES